jgi:hypothetical protein
MPVCGAAQVLYRGAQAGDRGGAQLLDRGAHSYVVADTAKIA